MRRTRALAFKGTAAIRSFFEDWVAAYEEYEQEIVENLTRFSLIGGG
jgi:hypothetical protein